MFKNMSIKIKLQLIIFATIVTVASIVGIQSVLSMKKLSEEKVVQYRISSYENKENELKNYVEIAVKTVEAYHERTSPDKIKLEVQKYITEQTNFLFSIIESEYERNKDLLSESELKERIIDIIKDTRYGQAGYFWINDFKYNMIMHPIKKELSGVNFKNNKEVPFVELGINELNKTNKSEGFIEYSFYNPNSKKTVEKASIVKVFKPYNWIIGTGSYIDDITTKLQEDAIRTVSTMKYGLDGYFWINDSNHVVVMHTIKPSLAGQNLSNLQDPNGKYLYREIVKVANANKLGGKVEYMWSKPDRKEPQPKMSYVKKFGPWDWIVGTGAYIDEIEDNILVMNEKTNSDINEFIFNILITSIIALIVLLIASFFITKRAIETPLKNFQDGLMSFFKYLNKENKNVDLLVNDSNDEIGTMVKVVNENITKVQIGIEEDTKFLNEVGLVVEKVKKGYLTNRLETKVTAENLENLRKNFNEMLISLNSNIGNDINKILAVLENFGKYDFRDEIKNDAGEVSVSLNNVAKLITQMLIENKQNGLTLDRSSDILLENVDILNKNSNEAAVALEETAAALEEITSNISHNTETIIKMAGFASQLTVSAKEGEGLANQTTEAMNDIDAQVTSINNAISVIDQIAFQTNILSLNAAVEAATAGEAGKGFAVVAQEVRNLASRSAEAAKEIKTLVENATKKANDGKIIASKMIEGYSGLNNNILKTIALIDDVENASKEQQLGIEQINDAVASLDQQTQENASISNKTHEVAVLTDSIAKLVVQSANEKEFHGKDSVKAKVIENN